MDGTNSVGILETFSSAIEQVAESVSPSVVSVSSDGRNGTGIVWDDEGHIVTAYHVVNGLEEVEVGSDSGETFTAKVVGHDKSSDLALLKIEGKLKPIAKGDSESLRVGQFVLAIGNALGLPGAPTVSLGVISALGRPLPGTDFVLEGLVQTDAAINPGNSGGPLADLEGRVIGINTAMIPFAQGVGFAIPSGTIKTIIDQISKNGRVVRPWLGISGLDVNPSIARRYGLSVESGVLLAEVMRDSPAHVAGLREGDIVVGIGENKVEQMKGLVTALSKSVIGERVTMSFVRTGTTYEADLRLAEAPVPLLTRRR